MNNSNWHGGKGSTPRGTDHKKYTDNWDKIFGPKIKPEEWDKNKEKDADKSNNK
jgi:hypothetical protein